MLASALIAFMRRALIPHVMDAGRESESLAAFAYKSRGTLLPQSLQLPMLRSAWFPAGFCGHALRQFPSIPSASRGPFPPTLLGERW